MTELWERQYGESRQAYAAFKEYRDLPPHQRTLAKAAEKYGRSVRLIERWSGQWQWMKRVAAFDLDQDRFKLQAERDAIIEMSRRQAQIALMFQTKLIQRLNDIDPGELEPTDLARWFEVATKVERLARGLPDQITREEITGAGGGPISIEEKYERLHLIMANPEARAALQSLQTSLKTIKPIPVEANGGVVDDDG